MRKLIILSILLFYFIIACNDASTSLKEGEKLAQIHCGSCHLFPAATLLSKSEWSKVLPNMGLRLGIKKEYEKLDSVNSFEEEVYSKHQIINDSDWEKIKNYYLKTSPENLDNSNKVKLKLLRNRFETLMPLSLSEEVPNITSIRIDPKRKQIYAADEINKLIYFLDSKSKITATFKGLPAISDIQLQDKGVFVTYIGRDIRLTKQKNGYSEYVQIEGQKITNTKIALKGLYRPTTSIKANLDNKGDDEIISCEFGVNKGKFSIWKKDHNTYKRIYEENRPGGISSQIIDLDKDGKLDVVVLYSQGNEQIIWYKNKGNLQFERKELLSFPPVYGSNNFEITDIDYDGKYDILYTCGDNADYSITQKPYHGLYIYKNIGNLNFKKTHFFPIDGATKSLARDFDNDGDIDIACIAFFSNFSDPSSSNFIYFENTKGKFEPKGLNIQKLGRWLVMDAADLDQDGDIDIALGSHPFGETISPHLNEWRNSTGILLLENITK